MSKLNKFLRILALLGVILEVIRPVISQDIPDDDPRGPSGVLLHRVDEHLIKVQTGGPDTTGV